MSQAETGGSVNNMVLVHGGFVDAVSIVQNPTISLADDMAVTSECWPRRTVRPFSSAIRTAASSSPRPGPIRGSRDWSTSLHSHPPLPRVDVVHRVHSWGLDAFRRIFGAIRCPRG